MGPTQQPLGYMDVPIRQLDRSIWDMPIVVVIVQVEAVQVSDPGRNTPVVEPSEIVVVQIQPMLIIAGKCGQGVERPLIWLVGLLLVAIAVGNGRVEEHGEGQARG